MDGLIGVMGVIAVFIIVFLILREFWCWYWKVNVGLNLQEDILKELKDIKESIQNSASNTKGHNRSDNTIP